MNWSWMLVLHAVSPAEEMEQMKTFGQVIVGARKAAGLTQKAVAERLRRGDGRKVLPP
jgi:ribosome-binding protein aMBF1 (putative translation factor)